MPPKRKYTIRDIQSSFASEGYILIDAPDRYKNAKQHFEYICPAQHKARITWSDWKQGYRCRQCGIKRRTQKNRKYTINDIIGVLTREQYRLVDNSQEFKSSHQYFEYICPAQHRARTTWSEWKKGYRCPYCAGKRVSFEQMKENAYRRGIEIVSSEDDYKNCYSKIQVRCPTKKHVYEVSWTNFQQGSGCPKCSHSQSKGELQIIEYLRSRRVYVIERDRSILGGKELDIFCPSKDWMKKKGKRILGERGNDTKDSY